MSRASLLAMAAAAAASLPDDHPAKQPLEYPYYRVGEGLGETVRAVARQAQQDLFAPIKRKGNYAERLRQHFAATRRNAQVRGSDGPEA